MLDKLQQVLFISCTGYLVLSSKHWLDVPFPTNQAVEMPLLTNTPSIGSMILDAGQDDTECYLAEHWRTYIHRQTSST